MKADLLRARDMKRYINQLTVAKKQCEKRIRLLGGPNYENNEEGGPDDSDEPQSQKVGRKLVRLPCCQRTEHLNIFFSKHFNISSFLGALLVCLCFELKLCMAAEVLTLSLSSSTSRFSSLMTSCAIQVTGSISEFTWRELIREL